MACAVCYHNCCVFSTRLHDPQGGAPMPFAREGCCRTSGCLDCPVPYTINGGLHSITGETQRRVARPITERHSLPGANGLSLGMRQTDFLGFILPDLPKPIHARWPGPSTKLWKPLTPASPSRTATSDPMVERECLAKLVSRKADDIGLLPSRRNDVRLRVRWAGYRRDSQGR
jgi:hypothetical protein